MAPIQRPIRLELLFRERYEKCPNNLMERRKIKATFEGFAEFNQAVNKTKRLVLFYYGSQLSSRFTLGMIM